MTAKVTAQGVLIPKEWLGDAEEVEIHKENGSIVIVPAAKADPIFALGKHPVEADVSDASINHDAYL